MRDVDRGRDQAVPAGSGHEVLPQVVEDRVRRLEHGHPRPLRPRPRKESVEERSVPVLQLQAPLPRVVQLLHHRGQQRLLRERELAPRLEVEEQCQQLVDHGVLELPG